ncbi:RagB/SusD family nutrient uptake outer membrane protein [Sphingobacterium sp. DN00404]|uniref:RagB/SusD family nutrient uptake outer membrane protein n=1 Tax=Sphingobacterium micropteri TaxID=2763501 RepID=A0ABR7YLI6_9SPHI|nr:RagB/SusD family nutrient uptake outer membrane protein [Sphingobacterium micropteri]MBD1432191.1 RagB/SusD family nutrient uptake outer membrane protein [Sphingobacterium micropteri]
MIQYIRTFTLLSLAACLLILASCSKDFLGKPDSSDVTIDTIFSERIKAETFLWETYGSSISGGLPRDWGRWEGVGASMLMAACDEGDVYDDWPESNLFNTGVWGPQRVPEDGFGHHYKGIRNANIFIENIERVPDISDTERAQMRAEAVFLRALKHAELLKRYGGIPIVDHVLLADGEVQLPRNSYAECVDFIVQSCDEAATVLPDTYPSAFLGRITKGAALALKSRVLLFAASPLANSPTPYNTQDREFTGYTDYNPERWRAAADAAKAVLDWAAGAGNIRLIVDAQNPGNAYETAVSQPDNAEIILADKSVDWWGDWWPMTFQFVMPRGVYNGWYGHGVTLQHAQKYYTVAGNDQDWPNEGSYAEFLDKMGEMEPRFQRSVFYSGSSFNDQYGVREFYRRNNGAWTEHAPVNGVGYMKKFLARFNWGGGRFNWPIFRLAEFYLNYAEALNEVSPMDNQSFTALNAIRNRAGIPEANNGDQRYNSQEKLREAIRRERAIELAFEEHRFWDVRRWMIASNEGVMRGAMYGLNLYQQGDGSIVYRKEVFENRVWEDRMYVYPIPQTEYDKGYISQTPGW